VLQERRRWSYRLAWLLCAATAVLLFAGALVTSTGSSLAVPDWPLAYGQLFPPMVGGILYEHGHRLVAATVGLLAIATAVWLGWAEPRRWVRWLAYALLALVILQGLLGGLTVLLLLPKAISIAHALTAQVFFLLTVGLVQVTAPGWEGLAGPGSSRRPGRAAPWATATLVVLFIELGVGAAVRHFGAGLAIPDFPLAYGRLIPPVLAFPVAIHFAHRVIAVLALLLVAATLWEVLRRHGSEPALRNPALATAVLLVVQILLGGGIIWSQRGVILTSLHVVNGALLIAATGLLALRGWTAEAPVRASAPRSSLEASPR
jgi:cytochrome c oxidase assembly protein subunit 15